jgi:CDGSH-type Zn-finger protein
MTVEHAVRERPTERWTWPVGPPGCGSSTTSTCPSRSSRPSPGSRTWPSPSLPTTRPHAGPCSRTCRRHCLAPSTPRPPAPISSPTARVCAAGWVDMPTMPQIALCRCGQSASKPVCDGTHADIGFIDAKDPNRVPDRVDTYVGLQLTVRDNRGTCAHSGFCTAGCPPCSNAMPTRSSPPAAAARTRWSAPCGPAPPGR